MAYEACRILHRLGADVRVFDPKELPMKDDVSMGHEKVQELRGLSAWSDGQVWCSPEQHGTVVCLPTPPPPSSSKKTNTLPDSSIQKPDRLDTPLHRLCSPNAIPDPLNNPSKWWQSILQYSKLATNSRPVDAHVYDSEPIELTKSIYPI